MLTLSGIYISTIFSIITIGRHGINGRVILNMLKRSFGNSDFSNSIGRAKNAIGHYLNLENDEFKRVLLTDLERVSRLNLQSMRSFLLYPKYQTLSGKLSWSYYCGYLSVSKEFLKNACSTYSLQCWQQI